MHSPDLFAWQQLVQGTPPEHLTFRPWHLRQLGRLAETDIGEKNAYAMLFELFARILSGILMSRNPQAALTDNQ